MFPEGARVLELGGGDRPRFHPNLDSRPLPTVDIVADLNQPLPVEDASFDGVASFYALEHLSWRNLKPFLAEIARVLKTGGKAVLVTANLKEQARVIANRERWDGTESELVFGSQDYEQNTHKLGLSPEYAIRLFNELGMACAVSPLEGCATDMVIQAVKVPLDRYQWMRREIPAGATVVDIGCSDGPVTWNVPNVTYADIEPYEKLAADMVKLGRPPFPQERFVQINADVGLPFTDQQFDVALLGEIVEHVADPVAVLREGLRVARKVVVTTPNEWAWEERWLPFANPVHVRHYTEALFKRHLADAGYRCEVGRLDYDGWSFWTAVETAVEINDSPRDNVQAPVAVVPVQVEATPPPTLSGPPLKIALYSSPFLTVPPTGYGGMERVVYDLAVALAQQGHRVTVFAPDGSYAEGCEMVHIGSAANRTDVDWLGEETRVFDLCRERLVSGGYDVVHGHDWLGLEYRLRENGLKIIHTHHGGLTPTWWKAPAPFPLNLVAISAFMQSQYRANGFHSEYVYNGIDLGKYAYKAEKGNRLLFVGRIDSFKRPDLAIEVAHKTGLPLDIVGGTFVQDQGYLKQIEADCDGKQIVFYRDPPQDLKVRLMQEARCLLFPSQMAEPFGLVAAEAMACGTPVVALADGAIAEVVASGASGFVCGSADEMVKAVANVGKITPQACRDRVERLFSRERMAASYVELYRRVIAGGEW